ncbi:UDP-glucose/GDP-mannose dehydrogenase family protein [Gammaproteobacteria bacterium]|nr:UDP-glucose/GDP-mannose dehydrogenase family protein [Gammaproteobacteria bacterium]MDB9842359.1 UDP-glucose/GDP-mannose dehydrogenase family protein [Gammaproteobacteria bacterium]
MKVSIIGSGYVGLVTGACLADMENHVTCLDIDKSKIQSLNSGSIPIYEPDLSDLVKKNITAGFLNFVSSYSKISDADIFFICVDTPNDQNQKPNLNNLFSVCNSLCNILTKNSVVVLKSTVPLGTNGVISRLFGENLPKNISAEVVSNPEFLREGSAISDFVRPERIIIGSNSDHAISILKDLYAPYSRKKNKILTMSPASAELSKYASNSFLATKISFINEMAIIAEEVGADMHEVRDGIGSDSRIGDQFLYSGLGYGGSCFPKDINALISFQNENNLSSNILQATNTQNKSMEIFFISKILDFFQEPETKSLLFWGSAFKPNTDDVRESISIKLILFLAEKFASIGLYDPKALDNSRIALENKDNVLFLTNKYEDIDNYDALIICTEWKEFWNPNYEKLKKIKSKAIFDGRNILKKEKVIKNGLTYFGIGT